MAREVTFHGKLMAKRTDWMGYTTYVFEDLEPDLEYVMCTQFPNWEQGAILVGDTGFVSVRYVNAGMDTWFDGTQFIPYRNTDVHFLKFIPDNQPPGDIVLDQD